MVIRHCLLRFAAIHHCITRALLFNSVRHLVYHLRTVFLYQVERFFWEVHKVPLFTKRLAALHASQGFSGQAASVQQLIETVARASIQLQSSAGFEAVLALLLLAGNTMNTGGARGGAAGFDLDILTKLRDVKSMHRGVAKRSHSLLQMMVLLAEERLAGTAGQWVEEVRDVSQASKGESAEIKRWYLGCAFLVCSSLLSMRRAVYLSVACMPSSQS